MKMGLSLSDQIMLAALIFFVLSVLFVLVLMVHFQKRQSRVIINSPEIPNESPQENQNINGVTVGGNYFSDGNFTILFQPNQRSISDNTVVWNSNRSDSDKFVKITVTDKIILETNLDYVYIVGHTNVNDIDINTEKITPLLVSRINTILL